MTLQFETTPLLNRGNSMGSRPGSVMTAGPPMKKYGKLVLVDLAGSERLKVRLFMQQNPNDGSNMPWEEHAALLLMLLITRRSWCCHVICPFYSVVSCCNAVYH